MYKTCFILNVNLSRPDMDGGSFEEFSTPQGYTIQTIYY